ncbi:hypothetical protein CR513_54698, partial [Mucuna pruriens]
MVKGSIHNEEMRRKTRGDFGVLKMGNDGVTKVIGVGDVCLQTNMGIHEKNPPKTPRLNGLAERMNKTLIERVRCMLSETRLPKHFLGQTLYIAVHVTNLSPRVALNIEMSNKIWFGKDVKYDYLRVFNCKAFVHVPKHERSKLDMKIKQCIFIGYGPYEYGYRLYDLVEKKPFRSRDVKFMENQTIEDINKNDEQYNYVGDLQLVDGFDIPFDDDAEEEQEMSQDENLGDAPKPPPIQLRILDNM